MSGTVSETRAIVEPMFSTVERPTSRSTSVGASVMVAAADGAAADAANVGAGCCARGAATRMTMIATTSAAVVAGLAFVARRKRRCSVVYAEVIVVVPWLKTAISSQRSASSAHLIT